MKKGLLLFTLCVCFVVVNAQELTIEELKAQKAAVEAQIAPFQAQIDPLAGQVASLDAQISKFPGWYKGAFGTIGFNASNFNNWVNAANPNSKNTTILASFNGFVNEIRDKYFWRNSGSLNLGWQKLVEDKAIPEQQDKEFTQTADVFNISSLYGRNITKKVAMSGLGEYRTTILNNFNNPGYLDLGVGFTLTPISNLVVVLHPLNYNFVFAKEDSNFESSLGTKVVANYNTTIAEKVKWRSNLSGFMSYKDLGDLSNFTWTNGFGFSAFKGIGVGIEHAVRFSKQETVNSPNGNDQQYWILGLTYNI